MKKTLMLWRNGAIKKAKINNAILVKVVEQYKTFKDATLAEKKGKTAQFWMQYGKIVDLYLLSHRSIKSNDVHTFCCVLFELCPKLCTMDETLRTRISLCKE